VRFTVVVQLKIVIQACPKGVSVLMGMEVDVLILYAPPQPLDEYVVQVAAFSIHADADVAFQQNGGEGVSGKLGALVRIEYLRHRMLQGSDQGFNTEGAFKAVGHLPGQHEPTVPIHDRHQVHEAA